MLIRKADASDTEELIRLRLLYLSEHFGDISDTRQQISEQLRSYFEAHTSRDFWAFLAEEDGVTIACAFLVVQEKPANPRFPTGRTGLLLNVYTVPENRRKGAASRLLEAVIQESESIGLSYIELTATESGKPLYQKHGFEFKNNTDEMTLVIKNK